jgi:hypothetical protein
MANNYGQTILSSWNQAGAMDLQNQQARAAQRENQQGAYEDTWNKLQIQGIVDIAKEGPNKGYATFNMERAMEELPKGALANYLDYALGKSNLTKYQGADGRLKQGKIVGIHKITKEQDPANAGMYAIAIKNEKGVMSFLSRDRREVGVKEGRAANDLGNNPLLLDAEDLQRYADIGARAILAKTPQASQVSYGMLADDLEAKKNEPGREKRAKAVSALATANRNQHLAALGLNPDETIDLDSPLSKRIATEGQILELGVTDDSPNAAIAQTVALEDLYSGTKTGEGPTVIGDNETRDIKGKPIPPRPEASRAHGNRKQKEWDKKYGPGGTLVEGEAKAETESQTDKVEWNDPNELWADMPAFRQSNMNKAMKEIEHELGRPEDQTALAQDMLGPAGSPAGKQVKKVFDHLELPTKSGLVTKEHWRQAKTYMLALKGDPTAKVTTSLDQANNKDGVGGTPDEEATTELRKFLETEEIGTMEDYLKWADEKLPPATKDYANWVIAAMGSGGDPKATEANYKQLSGQVERGLKVDEGNLKAKQDANELAMLKEIGSINARYSAASKADGKVLTQITKNYDDVLDNYALDRKTGLWRPLDDSDKPNLQIDTIIDKGGTAIANLRAALAGNQFENPQSAEMAADRLNEMSGTMIEMLAAQGSDRSFWKTESLKDFGLFGFGLFGRSPTRASMGNPFTQMRIKGNKIVFVTKAYNTQRNEKGEIIRGGPRETRNSVSKIVVANALFGASDEGAMAELNQLLIDNEVKGINE